MCDAFHLLSHNKTLPHIRQGIETNYYSASILIVHQTGVTC